MQRRMKIQASSSITILGILTILVQFVAYYIFDSSILILGTACLISAVCCHILLEQTSTYITCFDFSLLTLFISFIIVIITYYGNVETFLPYTGTMLGIVLINWLVPMLHSFFRYMLDYGTKTDEFPEFYRYSSILFLLFYVIVLIYGNFAKDAFPWAYREAVNAANLKPFNIISARIESCLYGQLPLNDIITYLASRILTYLPYGFFIALVLRGQNRVVRFFSLLFVPFLIEALQYFMIPGRCDIDDLIYALLGGLLGCFLFFLTNVLFRAVSGRDFLMKDTVYRNSLHF